MKIRGTLSIEGIDLHVDIEAPDDAQELYVTNVNPNCLVVPKERWRVEFMGLPPEIVAQLHDRQIYVLGELVDASWELKADNLENDTRQVITTAISDLRKLALLFEGDAGESRLGHRLQRDSEISVTVGNVRSERLLNQDISSIGLQKRQEDALRTDRSVTTVRDLVSLGEAKIIMTKHMDQKGLERIESVLGRVGIKLSE